MANNLYDSGSYDAQGDINSAGNRARVGGSTFTAFVWQGQVISFARQISVQSPAPVGSGTVPIHPLDAPYPVELVTPQALTMGMITLELYELYGANVWNRLGGTFGTASSGVVDLANIFAAVANSANPITIMRIINPPSLRQNANNGGRYTEEFHNCVISSLTDGETIEIGTMEVLKQIEVNYTHITRGGQNNILTNRSSISNPGSVQGDPGSGGTG